MIVEPLRVLGVPGSLPEALGGAAAFHRCEDVANDLRQLPADEPPRSLADRESASAAGGRPRSRDRLDNPRDDTGVALLLVAGSDPSGPAKRLNDRVADEEPDAA